MDDLRKAALKSRLPPRNPSNRPMAGRRDYTPTSWQEYFDKVSSIQVDDDVFRVYERGNEGPVCYFLHGGGFSALSWALLSKSLTELVNCRCVAVDCRGHGETMTTDDSLLSAEVLVRDVGRVLSALYKDDPPPIILIGHSMGGAVAIRTVASEILPTVVGLIVIDVVEGSALEALSSMQSFLRGRPSSFPSLERAIEYCVRTGQIKNLQSAKVSVAGQLKRLGGDDVSAVTVLENAPPLPDKAAIDLKEIEEEESDTNIRNDEAVSECQLKSTDGGAMGNREEFRKPTSPSRSEDSYSYTWRINLAETEKFWKGWFEGMSKTFLSCNVPKLLLLAGVDRLDKELTVGQMQGKFQMQLLPQCGHAIHEDSPEKVAEVIANFLRRNKLAESISTEINIIPPCC